MKKTKLGYLRDNKYFIPDTCVVCGNEFDNPSQGENDVVLCSKKCSEQFRENPDHFYKLYKKQYKERQ